MQVEGEWEREPKKSDDDEEDTALCRGVAVELFHDAGLGVTGGETSGQT